MTKRYITEGGVVLDTKTGLEWQAGCTGPRTWQAARDYAETLGGGWRLPTIEELFTLVDFGRVIPASQFPGMPSEWFWSSSVAAYSASYAWFVNFGYGYVRNGGKDNTLHVRCVRRGPCKCEEG